MQPLITLSSDFAVQSQGVGAMEATIFAIAPNARVMHLMHGIPGFDVIAAARTMETVRFLPVGIHVCVCDPGVGTSRKGLAIQTARGDYFVGPDNGLFGPATRLLGGTVSVHELANPELMRQPVSPIFHGRDVFAPAAAHLANGISIRDFGRALDPKTLVAPPYEEAFVDGDFLVCTAIQVNKFGSIHLNILYQQWEELNFRLGESATIVLENGNRVTLPVGETFGNVPPGNNLIMKDDYGRVEIAKNLGSFISEHPIAIGDRVKLVVPKR